MRKYSHKRSDRIADQIHKDIVNILRKEIKDPRINWVTISEVVVNSDNTWATIYWTVLNKGDKEAVMLGLEKARGFIRSQLSKGFQTYTIPNIKFVYDESLERASKIEALINTVK